MRRGERGGERRGEGRGEKGERWEGRREKREGRGEERSNCMVLRHGTAIVITENNHHKTSPSLVCFHYACYIHLHNVKHEESKHVHTQLHKYLLCRHALQSIEIHTCTLCIYIYYTVHIHNIYCTLCIYVLYIIYTVHLCIPMTTATD